jgi:hypothetical protein
MVMDSDIGLEGGWTKVEVPEAILIVLRDLVGPNQGDDETTINLMNGRIRYPHDGRYL